MEQEIKDKLKEITFPIRKVIYDHIGKLTLRFDELYSFDSSYIPKIDIEHVNDVNKFYRIYIHSDKTRSDFKFPSLFSSIKESLMSKGYIFPNGIKQTIYKKKGERMIFLKVDHSLAFEMGISDEPTGRYKSFEQSPVFWFSIIIDKSLTQTSL